MSDYDETKYQLDFIVIFQLEFYFKFLFISVFLFFNLHLFLFQSGFSNLTFQQTLF